MQINTASTGGNARSEPRDEVFHRARAMRRDGGAFSLTVVNLSPHGLMARCEEMLSAGERLTVSLPMVGLVRAEVRWALGGRIGCQLDAAIPSSRYHELIVAMRR